MLALAVMAAFAVLMVAGVLLRPLIPIDETRYIDVAWEMRLNHSWLLPLKNYGLYTDKPPLLFWLINLVWNVTGVQGVSARLVAPAFGLVAIWGTWALGRALWDAKTGATAAIVLAGFSVFVAFAGLTMFDTMLASATLLGIWALWRVFHRKEFDRTGWVLFGLALALGIYAKGPVIFLHLLPALLAAPLWAAAESRPPLHSVLGGAALSLGIALVLVAVWLVPAAITGGEEYRYMILWKQTAGRTVDSFAHARPIWWFTALLPALLFPWIWSGALWRGFARLSVSDPALRLCLVWALAGLLLFSLVSGKQLHYLLPEMPAAALIFGRALSLVEAKGRRNPLVAGLLLLAAIAFIALSFGAGGAKTAALLQPWGAVLVISAGLAVAAFLVWKLAPLPGLALAGLAVVLACDLVIGTTRLGTVYDSGVIGRMISPVQKAGIAIVIDQYNEQFDFEGQLVPPVQHPAPGEAGPWLAAHPGGVLLSECRDAPLPVEKAQKVPFNGRDWCLWWGAESGRAAPQN